MNQQAFQESVNDTFLMTQCQELVGDALEKEVPLNTICCMCKDYQTKYLAVKAEDPSLSQRFTFQMYWELEKTHRCK